MPDVEDAPVVPKKEHSRELSLSSISSPGAEHEADLDGQASPQQNVQVQKRKGGRKPIYATSEERKQRNRQAQAAFRERRTEYIKQLETTIKQQDETLQTLQQNHRSAADECLMLRYKNSLLERILLEKGIDVQSELKKKEITIPGKVPASLPQPTPVQRAAINRHQQLSRSNTMPSPQLHKQGGSNLPDQSPQLQSAPHPPLGSPTMIRGSSFALQGGMNPPPAGYKPPLHPLRPAPSPSLSSPPSSAGLQPIAPNPAGRTGRPAIWPSPYQTHIQQLEQEYDASDIMDDNDGDEPTGTTTYPQSFPMHQQQHQQAYTPHEPPEGCSRVQQGQQGTIQASGDPNAPNLNQMPGQMSGQMMGQMSGQMSGQPFESFDPSFDSDPFGLSASMHFPTQFSFQESSMRK